MRQTTLFDNKHFSSSRDEKRKTPFTRSIDVDRVRVYEINDTTPSIKPIELEPARNEKFSGQ